MSVRQGRPSRFWGAIVGIALLLLGVILVIVILLSARLRQPVQVTVLRPAPAEKAAAPTPPASASSPSEPTAARPSARPSHSQERPAAADRDREPPARTATPPVKVVEKVEKVVEKQVRVVEKPVKVVEKPVKGVEKPARRRPAPTASNRLAPLPARRPSDTAPLSTGGPNDGTSVSTSKPGDRDEAAGTFLETGLPSQLTYAGQVWNASDLVQDISADLLAVDGRTVDGHTVYHDGDAASPFPQIYVKVAGETDQYVRYVRTSS